MLVTFLQFCPFSNITWLVALNISIIPAVRVALVKDLIKNDSITSKGGCSKVVSLS